MATVIDIASRRVVGYALTDHLRTELRDCNFNGSVALSVVAVRDLN